MSIMTSLYRLALSKRACGRVLRQAHDYYQALQRDSLRHQVSPRTDRTETQQVFRSGADRLTSYAQGDEVYDNDIAGAIIDTVVRLTVGPQGGRPYFAGAAGAQQSWDRWARACGYAEGESWGEMLSMILRAVLVHGDCLLLIDPVLTGGRMRLWDADQICPVGNADFDRWGDAMGVPTRGSEDDAIWRQVDGAVLDPEGVVQGFFVTYRRNQYSCRLDQATYLPASLCRRVSQHLKISQYRGEAAILPMQELIHDTGALLKSEVAAAKNTAEMSIILGKPVPNAKLSAALDGAIDPETGKIDEEVAAAAGLSAEDIKALATTTLGGRKQQLAALEGKSSIGIVEKGTEVHELNNSARPAQPVQGWLDKLSDICGQRLGVQSCLSRGRSDASYSAGQIELAISWAKIAEHQLLLERQVLDYAISRVCPGAAYTVQWPRCFEIDPQKAEATYDAQLKGGRATFQGLVGPDWRRRVDDLAEFQSYCKAKGVDPKTYSWYGETAAGNAKTAPVPDPLTTTPQNV